MLREGFPDIVVCCEVWLTAEEAHPCSGFPRQQFREHPTDEPPELLLRQEIKKAARV